jgi:hypothetical protein
MAAFLRHLRVRRRVPVTVRLAAVLAVLFAVAVPLPPLAWPVRGSVSTAPANDPAESQEDGTTGEAVVGVAARAALPRTAAAPRPDPPPLPRTAAPPARPPVPSIPAGPALGQRLRC